MKKFHDVCLLMVLSALFLASHIQLQAEPQHDSAVHRQPPAVQGQNAAHDEAEKPDDPLGRSTPHGTVFGFLQTVKNGKYKDATEYLELSNYERLATGEELARQLHALMDNAFVGHVGALTYPREGSIQPGVSRDHEEIGVFRLNDTEIPVDLVRVSDARAGDIWLFSSETLARVPSLFDQIE